MSKKITKKEKLRVIDPLEDNEITCKFFLKYEIDACPYPELINDILKSYSKIVECKGFPECDYCLDLRQHLEDLSDSNY